MSHLATDPLRLLESAAGRAPPTGLRRTPLQQRFLTILFSDLSSSIGWSAQLDWLAYAQLLRELRTLFRATVARHGGAIARMQGDGMLAIFGQDARSDSDGYRAICCALELHRAVRAIAPRAMEAAWAALHSGIYAGLTYVERGDMERGRFDLVGSAPGLAARLSDLAGRDGVLVTEQVIAPCLDAFCITARQALSVKGWPEPLATCAVLGHAAARPAPFGAIAPTQGRGVLKDMRMHRPAAALSAGSTAHG